MSVLLACIHSLAGGFIPIDNDVAIHYRHPAPSRDRADSRFHRCFNDFEDFSREHIPDTLSSSSPWTNLNERIMRPRQVPKQPRKMLQKVSTVPAGNLLTQRSALRYFKSQNLVDDRRHLQALHSELQIELRDGPLRKTKRGFTSHLSIVIPTREK